MQKRWFIEMQCTWEKKLFLYAMNDVQFINKRNINLKCRLHIKEYWKDFLFISFTSNRLMSFIRLNSYLASYFPRMQNTERFSFTLNNFFPHISLNLFLYVSITRIDIPLHMCGCNCDENNSINICYRILYAFLLSLFYQLHSPAYSYSLSHCHKIRMLLKCNFFFYIFVILYFAM